MAEPKSKKSSSPQFPRKKPKPDQGKKSIYLHQFLIDRVGLDRLNSTSARVAAVLLRYLWICDEVITEVKPKFTKAEIDYLLDLPDKQSWVKPESNVDNLFATVSVAIRARPLDKPSDSDSFLKKIQSLKPWESVALVEWLEQVALIGNIKV